MLEASDLSKRFGRVHAVRKIGLSARPGCPLGLVGANGAGKSTTLRLLATLLAPDQGSIEIDGVDALDRPELARSRLGYLPESGAIHPEMTPSEYVGFRASLYTRFGLLRRRARRLAVERTLGLCDLVSVATRPIGTLSKGFTQRTALAGALVHDPPVVILDEPTNGLDVAQLHHTRDVLRRLSDERTVVISSHLVGEIERLCDEVAVIAGGRVVAHGSPAELAGRSATTVRVEFESGSSDRLIAAALAELEDAETTRAEGWSRVTGTSHDAASALESIGRAARAEGVALRTLESRRPSLDEALRGLIHAAGVGAGSDR
ncbi:MAG: ABC transporter ATP-binding protein [Planctomycetota bacterium]